MGHKVLTDDLQPAEHCAVSFAAALQEGKVKNTPWGSSFRAAPEILHGERERPRTTRSRGACSSCHQAGRGVAL